MAQLNELAPELLVEIFRHLPYRDLLRCIQTCRFLFQVITKSPGLDYHIHLQVAGVQNNPDYPLPIPTQLALLKEKERCWDFLDHKFRIEFASPGLSSGTFELSPSVLALGMAPDEGSYATQSVQFCTLPSIFQDDFDIESIVWKPVGVGMKIIDYGLSIEENDLIAFVVGQPDDDEPTTTDLAVVLLRYSTKQAHELAEKSVFSLCTATEDMGIPSLGIDISGENLAISIIFDAPDARIAASTLCIYNWRTGQSKTKPLEHRIPVFNNSLLFLREDILINPSVVRNSIDVYHILPSASILASDPPSAGSVVRLIHSLLLPTLEPEAFMFSISCRGSPNPTLGSASAASHFPRFTPKDKPYTNDPRNAVICFVMGLVLSNDTRQTFAMIVHRQSLLDLVPPNRIKPDAPGSPPYQGINDSAQDTPDTPFSLQAWETWGPPITRWFKNNYISRSYITCVSGPRYVQYTPSRMPEEVQGRPRDTIHVFNFNPAVVRIARHRGLSSETVDFEIVGEKRRERDTDPELEENVCPAKGIFASDLVGRLPYVRSTSKNKWDYDQVLMAEECLLGLKYQKFPNTHRLKSISVIYYG